MSYGKPLVVSDATAQETIVKRSQSGLIHKEKDVQEYTENVLELYQNSSLAKQYGANGKRFIEEEFSWEITSQSLIQLYAEI